MIYGKTLVYFHAAMRSKVLKALGLMWVVALLIINPSFAQTINVLQGKVVAVADGDTVTVLDANKQQHRIRLMGIDAPESRQAFGERSKQLLASLVFGKDVHVHYKKPDRYGRIIGKIMLGQRDINLVMVEQGMAWHYAQYARDQFKGDARIYALAQQNAQAQKLGLFADPAAQEPWEYRRSLRTRKSQ